MKTAAYVSFGFFGVLLIAMLTLFGLSVWESDARYGWLGVLAFVAAVLALFTGAFFASRAGLGVKEMKIIYIAGPMTGLPDFNYPAFHAAAHELTTRGYAVLNPADNKPDSDAPTWTDWMRLGLRQVLMADGLALLPGWENSRGAQVESFVAKSLGLDVRELSEWDTQS